MKAPIWQNSELAALVPAGPWQADDVERIYAALEVHGTLTMRSLASGVFPAAAVTGSASGSGYGNVWVRDNVFVAYAHLVAGQPAIAEQVVQSLFAFFSGQQKRFQDIIDGKVDPTDVCHRPHVRFNGERLPALSNERWAHAQNDALGYALWLAAKLIAKGVLAADARLVGTLALFPRFFSAIRYWQDTDSGHWEETRHCSAASIGTVVAGLEAVLAAAPALRTAGLGDDIIDLCASLAQQGRAALNAILPAECAQLSPRLNRRYDAALIFLVHPLGIVDGPLADLVLSDVDRFLSGDVGIRRYLRDSYWAPDYDERLPPEDRTRDFSEDLETRDVLLERIGDEAEWCLFDSVLSAHYGQRFCETRAEGAWDLQAHHFRRALAQVTPTWQCPELYYLKHGQRVPNPHTPLLWTQSNLLLAISALRTSAAIH